MHCMYYDNQGFESMCLRQINSTFLIIALATPPSYLYHPDVILLKAHERSIMLKQQQASAWGLRYRTAGRKAHCPKPRVLPQRPNSVLLPESSAVTVLHPSPLQTSHLCQSPVWLSSNHQTQLTQTPLFCLPKATECLSTCIACTLHPQIMRPYFHTCNCDLKNKHITLSGSPRGTRVPPQWLLYVIMKGYISTSASMHFKYKPHCATGASLHPVLYY